ncbi:hypothetical protein K466DRAFT_497326 [Polyporus arcularius HHB13444]|uniref:Protein-S-isoprenylcysteine O-methyltransferase n=1 Tax=Polyporus arcularius HHB13444 TaxID=1314778 RepID=A0A5C3P634_9APHY|nr:hypothetical protein K466DRAFT_497326 [Polyporus arcularius HHB13444]
MSYVPCTNPPSQRATLFEAGTDRFRVLICVCAHDYSYQWLAVLRHAIWALQAPTILLLSMTLANTPLVKVALLLAHAISTYMGFTPPVVPPPPREKLIRAPDFMRWHPRVQLAIFAMDRTVMCVLAVAEAVILLALWSTPANLLHRVVGAILSSANVPLDSVPLRLTPASVAACLLAISGGLLRRWCHRTLGRFFTLEVGIQDGHKLVTSGPYGIVRHPAYIGGLLMIAGNFMLLLSRGSFFTESGLRSTWVGKVIATTVVAHLTWVAVGSLYRTRTEDELMKREFGKSWEEWSQKTPYRILPFLY